MTNHLETRANNLLMQFRQFASQVREDQATYRNRKSEQIAAPPVETVDEKMQRIHNSKKSPARGGPTVPVTKIRMNGAVVADYSQTFTSGGEEYNLRNSNDQFAFMDRFWPGYPMEQWPVIQNSLSEQGKVSLAGATEFTRKLKAYYGREGR